MRHRSIPGLAALVLAGSAMLAAPAGAAEQPATSAPAVAAPAFSEGGTPQSTVFYRGPAGDVLYRTFINGRFDQTFSLGGRIVGAPGAARVWRDTSSRRTELAVRGTDDKLWVREHNDLQGGWSGWRSLGGVLAGPPAVLGSGEVTDFFVIGTDQAVWKKQVGNVPCGQTGWRRLGGVVLSGTGVAASGVDGVHALYVVGTNHQLYVDHYPGVSEEYGGWLKVPRRPPASAHPRPIADTPGFAEEPAHMVFFRDQATNRLMLLDRGEQEHYVDLGGALTSGLGAANLNDPRFEPPSVDVAVRGTDNRIWMRSERGGTWSPWRTW